MREQQQELSSATRSAGCAGRVPQLPAHPRVAGPAHPAAPGRRATCGIDAPTTSRAGATRAERPPLAAGRAALAHRPARPGETGSTSAPAAPGSPSSPARRWPRSQPRLGRWPPSWSRRPGCGPAPSPASSRSGPRSWPGTWSSAATASRTGRRKRGAAMATERVTLYGVAARRRPPGPLRRVDPELPASCSSATRWSRATGARHHRFFARQPRAARARWRSSRTGPAAATSWSTTRRSCAFYDERVPADVGLGAPLRLVVEAGPPRPARPARPSPRRPAARRRRRRLDAADFPDEWRQGELACGSATSSSRARPPTA